MAQAKLENVTSAFFFFSFSLHRREVKPSPTSSQHNPSFGKGPPRGVGLGKTAAWSSSALVGRYVMLVIVKTLASRIQPDIARSEESR